MSLTKIGQVPDVIIPEVPEVFSNFNYLIYKGRYTPLKTKVRFFLYLVYNRMPLWIFMRQMVNARVRQATLRCVIYSDTLYLQKMNASLPQDNHYTDMQNLCKL